MGARISIQFKKDKEKSIVLFSHWGGNEFAIKANDYIKELKTEQSQNPNSINDPLNRLEPNTVMVDFIRYITKNLTRVNGDLYLGAEENDGDNNNYGHHIINLNKNHGI